jgi:Subtilase family
MGGKAVARFRFDRERFREEYFAARSNSSSRGDLEGSDQSGSIEPSELRYIVEVGNENLGNVDYVNVMVQEVLGQDIEYQVDLLFGEMGDKPVPELLAPFYLLLLPGIRATDFSQSPYDLAYALRSMGSFASVEPDLPYQFSLGRSSSGARSVLPVPPDHAWSIKNIRADIAWNLPPPTGGVQDGEGISIGHLDTGWTHHVDLDQANLDLNRAKDFIVPTGNAEDPLGYKFSPGHGTKTGSVIMSEGDIISRPPGTSGPGEIIGVARKSTLVPVRCIRSVIIIFNSDVARAIRYATAVDCDVISMSLGGRPIKAMKLAIRDAVRSNVLVICAGGNEVRLVVWPARFPDAIAVSANNVLDRPWSRTSRGSAIDVSAPGEAVWVAIPDSTGQAFEPSDGTSYATANVAGAAALWLGFYGKKSLVQLASQRGISLQELFRAALRNTARRPQHWNLKKFGAGIVNVDDLLRVAPSSLSNLVSIRDDRSESEFWRYINSLQVGRNLYGYLKDMLGPYRQELFDFFGYELANLVIDYPELMGPEDMAEDGEVSGTSIDSIRSQLKGRVSSTLADYLEENG